MNSFTARYCSTPQARKRWMIGGGVTIGVIILIVIIAAATSGNNGVTQPFIGSMVLSEVPLVIGRNTFPRYLHSKFRNEINNFKFDNLSNWKDQNNIPRTDISRLRLGKVGVQLWTAYVDCSTDEKDAIARTLEQIDVIKRLIHANPANLVLVTDTDGIQRAFSNNRIASIITVSGGHAIDSRLGVLRLYYELGVRALTLTEECHTPWALSNNDDKMPIHELEDGLSTWGENVIKEMNRLGMIIDLSHASKALTQRVLSLTEAPVIFSNSGANSVTKHSRNIESDILIDVKHNDGLVMVSFDNDLVKTDDQEQATMESVIEHIKGIKTYASVDNIGIGADFDGATSVPVDLADVSTYPLLFDKLSTLDVDPWNREDLRKLANNNFIRVFKKVEDIRDANKENIFEAYMPDEDLRDEQSCRSDFPWPTVDPEEETTPTDSGEVTETTTETESTTTTVSSEENINNNSIEKIE